MALLANIFKLSFFIFNKNNFEGGFMLSISQATLNFILLQLTILFSDHP